MIEHPLTTCRCHTFTPACPIDCLKAVVSLATFNTLAHAYDAPFDPPVTVGRVIELLGQDQLRQIAGLGPGRIGEIQGGLVYAGLVADDSVAK